MMSDLKVWKRVYELSDELNQLKPWEKLWSEDLVCIELNPKDIVYVSIMGRNKECIGLTIYEGQEGYADFISVSQNYHDQETMKYVMFEQTSLTWYMGDRSEVPPLQKDIIKQLNLKFRGHNQWPYFISYKARFYPDSFHDIQAKRFIDIVEKLLMVLNKYMNNEIDVIFDEDEMLYMHKEDNQWVYEAMCLPEPIDKFSPISLTDQNVLNQLKTKKKSRQELCIDLVYLNTFINDSEYERPINALMLIVVEMNSGMLLHTEFLKPNDDVISYILSFAIPYFLDNGIPRALTVRNPSVYAALIEISKLCHIKMTQNGLKLVDEILDDMKDHLNM